MVGKSVLTDGKHHLNHVLHPDIDAAIMKYPFQTLKHSCEEGRRGGKGRGKESVWKTCIDENGRPIAICAMHRGTHPHTMHTQSKQKSHKTPGHSNQVHCHVPCSPRGASSVSFSPHSLRKPMATSTESLVGSSNSSVSISRARSSCSTWTEERQRSTGL